MWPWPWRHLAKSGVNLQALDMCRVLGLDLDLVSLLTWLDGDGRVGRATSEGASASWRRPGTIPPRPRVGRRRGRAVPVVRPRCDRALRTARSKHLPASTSRSRRIATGNTTHWTSAGATAGAESVTTEGGSSPIKFRTFRLERCI